jgi:hypothetical protein
MPGEESPSGDRIMSYSLLAAIVGAFQNDSELIAMLGKNTDGSPSIHPIHYRDVTDPVFPMVTVSRIGSGMQDNMFAEDVHFANRMDNPRFVICVWDKKNIDRCYGPYRRIDTILRGAPPTNTIPSHYMINYKVRRRLMRDDLFDTAQNAYYIYAEYETWLYDNPNNPIPIST